MEIIGAIASCVVLAIMLSGIVTLFIGGIVLMFDRDKAKKNKSESR